MIEDLYYKNKYQSLLYINFSECFLGSGCIQCDQIGCTVCDTSLNLILFNHSCICTIGFNLINGIC